MLKTVNLAHENIASGKKCNRKKGFCLCPVDCTYAKISFPAKVTGERKLGLNTMPIFHLVVKTSTTMVIDKFWSVQKSTKPICINTQP